MIAPGPSYEDGSDAEALAEQGEDPKRVSERLGHHTPSFTMDRCAHVTQTHHEEVADHLEQATSAGARGVAAVLSNYSPVASTIQARSAWQRWILPTAAVLGVGPWGSLAGAALFWLVGEAVGVTYADPGLFNFRFWPVMWLLLGLTLGFAGGAYLALRLVQRSPRVLGSIVVLWAVLMLSITLADSSGWDGLYFWVPGALLAVVVVRHRVRRA